MLDTLAVILTIAWLLGLVSSYTLGGFIHVLLVVAIVLILVQLAQRRHVEGENGKENYEKKHSRGVAR